MADTKREIERKYEGPPAGGDTPLPDLTDVPGVSRVIDKGVAELDATYYDTADQRLATASLTLRRRTGGDDAGWHLKLPVSEGVRDEIRAPLSDSVPDDLTALVRSRVREAELVPVVHLLSARDVRHLVDASGTLLAEVSVDRVRAERLSGGAGSAEWTEIEVELADDGDPAFLDKVEKKLRKAGLRRSASASKLAKALEDTAPRKSTKPEKPEKPEKSGRSGKEAKGEKATKATKEATDAKSGPPESAPRTAGDHVLAYVRAQRDAIVELDPAVRRDVPDSVHRMRVATRRLRSTFRSYGKVLDRTVTGPVGDELKWLAAELGVDRDQEVLTEHLTAALDGLPSDLIMGPVQARLDTWSGARRSGSRQRLIAVLDGRRYLDLLTTLDTLVAGPPLLEAAAKEPEKVIAKAVRKDFKKVADLVGQALELSPGSERDLAMHDARKKAKRTRYAAETATPALGEPAAELVKSMKSLQTLLGDHQDSVMVRETLRELAAEAQGADENAFTYGVLYGREEQRAAAVEAALPGEWEAIEDKGAV
ncbi:CYTH and CHAD domain-containing protein [Streptomyces sp. NBC_01764]|uniref:CYTH and CHAD domain-containing protein n=1 Tax=Streptomyces sp. NBC_01764 TaxID=2975935 RepID=UPI00224F418C|nr:CYTH and CHAD domain-containing protein [Streptomyces sp. NBC_01764]MCX4400771.1 CYTH and CHAD domain-containing protein [Streptomyces sp. NBC_01764]